MIDFTTEFGSRVTKQLESDQIVWLTTVGSDNMPQPNPVWFLWDGTSFLIYGLNGSHKLNNISNNPKVAINPNTDFGGEEIAILLGEARLDPSAPPANENAEFMKKYTEGIKSIEMTPKSFAEKYSIAFRVTPTKLRGF